MSKHDLLIIGAGLAGLRAAVEGVRQGLNVAVITKVHPVRSHSNAAQGGINAPLTDRGDEWEGHAYDTIKGSDFLADQDAVEIMSSEAGDAVTAVAVSPDGKYVVSGSRDMTMRLWDVAGGKEILKLGDYTSAISSVSISPDCKRIVSGSRDVVRVWDVA